MKIQRPDCVKTRRQGSVSIPLLGCSILRWSSPSSCVGGWQDPTGGHEGSVAITESDRILGTLYCGVSCRTMLTGK